MTAAELFEVVKDVTREAWPSMLRNHSTFDPAEPERFWIIYGPMGGDDKRCVHITADIAEHAFIGSMTAWRIADAKNHGGDVYIEQDKHGFRVQVNDIEYRASSLAAAFAARAMEIARAEGLDGGRELKDFVRLAQACKNNMRAMLQRIDDGCFVDSAAAAA